MITLAPSDTYDMVRTLRVGVYGFLIMGPSQHLWFNFLSKIFPRKDLFSTLKKITMGQTIYGPIVNSLFFSYNAALRGMLVSACFLPMVLNVPSVNRELANSWVVSLDMH